LLPNGTKLSDTYWYVEPKQPNTVDALEGYLYPDHYEFDKSATATTVVETMLSAFGAQLCPGPTNNPDAYILDQAQCKAHAATVDSKGTSVFTTLESAYDKDDRHAIYLALTVASITMREIPSLTNTHDIQGIASVYFNRYQHAIGNPHYPSDAGTLIQADPTVQYAVATDNPPKAGDTWWPNVNNQDLKSIETTNAYNTYVVPGLPPGPISAPISSVFLAAADPVSPDNGTLYYYFISGKCDHKTYFASNSDDQNANIAKYITSANC
jgi:cell division protein YceG involved in septum cleavage